MPTLRVSPNGNKFLSLEDAYPLLCELTKKLIPLKTACESLGISPARMEKWLDGRLGHQTELARLRAVAMIEMQEKMVLGNKGWQSQFRLFESIEPGIWIKKAATGKPVADVSPYAQQVRKH